MSCLRTGIGRTSAMGHVFRTCKDHKERLTPQPFVTEPLRWEEHHRRLNSKELDKRLDELNLNVYSLPEDREDPLRDIWHKIEEKDRLEMCVDGPPQRLGRYCPNTTRPGPCASEVWQNAWEAPIPEVCRGLKTSRLQGQ